MAPPPVHIYWCARPTLEEMSNTSANIEVSPAPPKRQPAETLFQRCFSFCGCERGPKRRAAPSAPPEPKILRLCAPPLRPTPQDAAPLAHSNQHTGPSPTCARSAVRKALSPGSSVAARLAISTSAVRAARTDAPKDRTVACRWALVDPVSACRSQRQVAVRCAKACRSEPQSAFPARRGVPRASACLLRAEVRRAQRQVAARRAARSGRAHEVGRSQRQATAQCAAQRGQSAPRRAARKIKVLVAGRRQLGSSAPAGWPVMGSALGTSLEESAVAGLRTAGTMSEFSTSGLPEM